MASIQIYELRPVGAELFQDSESFLDELNSQEITDIAGGLNLGSIVAGISANVAVAVSQDINILQVLSAFQGK